MASGTPAAQRDVVRVVSDDGRQIDLRLWRAPGSPRAVLQLLHGLSEHVERYARFAEACNAQGIAVAGHNHRGHGPQPEDGQPGHFADRDGRQRVLDDIECCHREIVHQFPDVPVVLLGHSMGSYFAQHFVVERRPSLAAIILSGSTSPNRTEVRTARLVGRLMQWIRGARADSQLFDRLLFGKYNKQFAPCRTAFDWLSRDTQEVDLYVADPLCGRPASYGLWLDLFDTLLAVSEESALRRFPDALPMLISGGERDPVGGDHALRQLAAKYKAAGQQSVSVKIYPGGRHEMLNETNRNSVTADWLGWIENTLAKP